MFHCNGWCFPWAVEGLEGLKPRTANTMIAVKTVARAMPTMKLLAAA
jgi:hypothetical protein